MKGQRMGMIEQSCKGKRQKQEWGKQIRTAKKKSNRKQKWEMMKD